MTKPTARQKILIRAAKAEAQMRADMAEKEKAQRTEPIAGSVAGYDAVTGDWQVRTPSGGIVRAQLMSDGSPTGKLLPVQRFANSQTNAINAPPSGNRGGNVTTQIEAAQRDVVNLLATEALDFRIEVPEAIEYTLSAYQHYPVRVEAIEGVVGATVATTPALGEIAAVGDPIAITLSALSVPVVPVLGSILLRRVG